MAWKNQCAATEVHGEGKELDQSMGRPRPRPRHGFNLQQALSLGHILGWMLSVKTYHPFLEHIAMEPSTAAIVHPAAVLTAFQPKLLDSVCSRLVLFRHGLLPVSVCHHLHTQQHLMCRAKGGLRQRILSCSIQCSIHSLLTLKGGEVLLT